jgi:hypothetical protein
MDRLFFKPEKNCLHPCRWHLLVIEDNTVLAFGAGGANLLFIVLVIIYNMEDNKSTSY